jgi:copper(I)-binding protein
MRSTSRISRDAGRAGSVRAAVLVSALLAFAAGGVSAASPGITLSGAWIRFVMQERPAAGYFTLANATGTPVVLVRASSPDCGMLMLHRTVSANGSDSMEAVTRVTVPAHGRMTFAPGGYHLMCMAPSSGVKRGSVIPVTLAFADGSTIEAQFPVRGPTGR